MKITETHPHTHKGNEDLVSDKTHPNRGPSLEEFLQEDGNLEVATAIAVKRVIAWQLAQAMDCQKLSKAMMARKMHTSRGQLDRVLNPEDGNVTLETLQRAARVVGRSLSVELR